MRDDFWLKEKLDKIWQAYFADVPQKNSVVIKFGQNARTRLGSIRKRNKSADCASEIFLTGFFKDEKVPEFIIDLTIAHEICHYAHGFSSPLPQLSKYPHLGGLVDNELKSRGFGEGLKKQKSWLKSEWPKIVGANLRRRQYRPKKRRVSGFNILKLLISN